MNIAIVGVGLMGGSLSLSLQQKSTNNYFVGVDSNPEHCKEAVALGLVDKCLPMEGAVDQSDLILLSVPVDIIEWMLPEILDRLKPNQTVVDFGSTKEKICAGVNEHTNRGRYVATHPMAGTENTGPSAAIAELYENKINIICEKERSDIDALEMAEGIFDLIGMKTIYMDAKSHDKHVAYVSHLSHVSSFMLGLTVLDIENDEKQIANLAGSGFQSTVRLAMSSPEMWAPIFSQNSKHVSSALEEYIIHLQDFKAMVDSQNSEGMINSMDRANDIRRILK